MAVTFHCLSASGALSGPVLGALEAALPRAATACSARLALADIDVVVMAVPWNTIPRIGVNGFSYDAHHIVLSVDAGHDKVRPDPGKALRPILLHELHHSARAGARNASHGRFYGGALVAEGLACCFEEEMGEPTPFYAVECHGEALQRFAEKARAQLHTPRRDLPGDPQAWMFGAARKDDAFPYQCGYSTGYALVKCWLEARGLTASQAAGVDEAEIIDDWLEDRIAPFGR